MNRLIFKKHLLAIALLLLCGVSAQAADDDLITQQITIKLDKAGTLPDRIGSSKKYKITNLKIIGEINGTDWCLIRQMAGSDYEGAPGVLESLDLSDAKIVRGGDLYLNNYQTSNDVLGPYAFFNCSNLTSLILPSNISSIREGAFRNCSGLTTIALPSNITKIDKFVFEDCSNLTSLEIPTKVTIIDYGAFLNCRALSSLLIPSSIYSIGYMAFNGCSSLTNLSIPSSVTSIKDGAFANCDNLSSIYVSWETPLLIPYSVFDNKTKTECLLYVPKGSLVSYLLADVWGDFKKNIVEYDATKVDNSVVDKEIKEVARYTANGQRLDTPTKGLNIVRYSDGSVRKELHN